MLKKLAILLSIGLIFISFCNTIFSTYYRYIQNSTYIQLFIVLFLFISVFILWLKKKKLRELLMKTKCIDLAFILLALYFSFQFFISTHFNILFDQILMFITFSIFYLILSIIWGNNNKNGIPRIFYVLSMTGVFQIIYSILQYFDIAATLFGYKFGGTFGNPGDLANFLALTYSITLGLLFIEKRKQRRIWLIVILVSHLFLITISLARTAWLATISSSIFIFAINLKSSTIWFKLRAILTKTKWIVPLCLFLSITILGIGGWKIYELKAASANGRIFIWQLCLQLITEKPLFGHGYESFLSSLRYGQINYFVTHPQDLKNGMLAANSAFAFNDFLQFMVEYGIVGGVLLMSLFVLPFRKTKLKNKNDKKILTIVRAFILALFVCGMFSYPLQNQSIVILLVIVLSIYSSLDQQIIFKLKWFSKLKYPIAIMSLFFCIFVGRFNYKKIINGLKWKQAFILLQTNPQEGADIYDSIFDFMKHDRSFISNFGLSLYKTGEYQKLVDYYEEYERYNPSSDILIMIGKSYEKLENYQIAEEKYRMASNLIPHLFIPRYQLFKLYQKKGEREKAFEEAKCMSEMKIKVYSEIVKNIKTEVNEYLFNENTKQSQNRKRSKTEQ